MKKWEKEILQKQIQDEQAVISRLEKVYKRSLAEIDDKILVLKSRDQIQSVIYQLKYQEALKKEIEAVYNKLSANWYSTIDEYLKNCYEDSFYSTMYSLHQEGIPLILPLDQKQVTQAAAQSSVYLSGKLSNSLYSDTKIIASRTIAHISKGMALNESYATISANIAKTTSIGMNNALRITRTEAHRITNEVKMKTITKAQDSGADVVKQWDSTIDRRTRPTHVELDGQLRELDQPFKIPSTGATAMYPGGFGIAKEDIHCRCALLQRARWALDKSEVEKTVGDLEDVPESQLDDWAKKFGVTKDELIKASNGIIESDGSINHRIKAQSYNEFKKKYQKKEKVETAKLQSQLDVLQQEKQNLLGGFKEEEINVWGDPQEIKQLESYNAQIADIQKKLAIDQLPKPKVPLQQYKKHEKKVGNFEELKKNAVRFNNGTEADKYHKKKNFVKSRWDNDLSANERDGIVTYTSNAYREINNDLRAGRLNGTRYEHEIKAATSGLEKTLLAEDTVVFRGMGNIDAFSAWSGISKSDLSKKAVQDSLVGTKLIKKGFMSTGTNAGSAWSGLQLEVYLPKGTQAMYVDPISRFRGEYEILVQRNSTFEIEEVKTDSNGYIKGLVLMLVEQNH